jgi:hypothetical protein
VNGDHLRGRGQGISFELPSSNGRGIVTDQKACAAPNAKQSCYAVYDDAGNNLNSLLKFKFSLTDDLKINEINAV